MPRRILTAFGLVAGLVAGPALAASGDLAVPGWRAGPPAEATLEAPQRYDCTGPACPSAGLSCLYAVAPPRPAGSRWLSAEDVMNPDVMPWADYEVWLAGAARQLKPALASDPSRSGFAERGVPALQALGGRDVVRRDYGLRTRAGYLAMPAFLWGAKGRLYTLACATAPEARQAARIPMIGLIEALAVLEPDE
ncbi:hypothetical protein [Aurantimonas sp. HBX-1]|uniref:hypothetical protein n=1 Tax=Aurantimonas sp. HBX-1 TaxID=2906072 RepID=UPI001F3151AF|nr:hypothetical protein [Aurantimonas sp. HBX-1]UIJ72991.1 hypothetical protein LXB15_04895 [Aurantimonas sp. HBX-1]